MIYKSLYRHDISNTLDSVLLGNKGVVRISNSSNSSKYISFQIADLIREIKIGGN